MLSFKYSRPQPSCFILFFCDIYRQRINTAADKIPFPVNITVFLKLNMQMAVHSDILIIRIALKPYNFSLFYTLPEPDFERPCKMAVDDLITQVFVSHNNGTPKIPKIIRSSGNYTVTYCSNRCSVVFLKIKTLIIAGGTLLYD